MKKIISAVMLIFLVVFAFSGCAYENTDENKDIDYIENGNLNSNGISVVDKEDDIYINLFPRTTKNG